MYTPGSVLVLLPVFAGQLVVDELFDDGLWRRGTRGTVPQVAPPTSLGVVHLDVSAVRRDAEHFDDSFVSIAAVTARLGELQTHPAILKYVHLSEQ